MLKVGYIGLGLMGKSIARNILKAGFPLFVHNRSRAAVDELVAEGATAASTPAVVAAQVDVVFTNQPDTPDVEQIVLGEKGIIEGAHHGLIYVDNSTIKPASARMLAERLSAKDTFALDAPVSGGDIGARNGTLTIMVGGDASALEKVMPVFQAMGKTVTHVGEAGAGQVAKAANQIMVAAQMVAMGELLVFSKKAGVDPRKFVIQFASMDRRVKSIIFTSAGLGEGKSTCVINLAITMAQEGMKVLLVDADLRKPIVHQRLGLDRKPGLVDALLGTTSWRSYIRSATDLMLGTVGVDRVMNTPGLDNLHILTSGSEAGNPNEFLNINKIKTLTSEMQEDYDIVLIDTPPILPVTDAVAFSSRVDGTILVYQVGRIGRNALKRAKFLLDHAQANVLGVVLTNVKSEVTPEYGLYRYEHR